MKRFGMIILMINVMVLITGCWDRRELNEITTVMGIAIDKTDDGSYLVTTQVVDPKQTAAKQQGGNGSPALIYQSKAETIAEALRRMSSITPRTIYFSHLRMLIIGENVAKEGLAESLDFFYREREFRPDFFVVISKGTNAASILKILTPLEKIPSQKMYSSLEVSEKLWAPTYGVRLNELLSNITNNGKEPILTGIKITGDQNKGETKDNLEQLTPHARLKYHGLAIFKKDKLVGWFNEQESKGWAYILNKVHRSVGNIPCPKGGRLVLEVTNSRSKILGELERGRPKIKIDLFLEANVNEVQCHVDLTDPRMITKLEKQAEKTFTEMLEASIEKAKRYKTDVFGFGKAIHNVDPPAWQELKKDWNEDFSQLPVTIHTKMNIRRTGTVNMSFLENLRE